MIRRSDLMTWWKVAVIITSICTVIIGAAVKVSVDASELKSDIAAIKLTVAEHARQLAERANVGPTLNRMEVQLNALQASATARADQFVDLNARISATLPTISERIKRIEDKIDSRDPRHHQPRGDDR